MVQKQLIAIVERELLEGGESKPLFMIRHAACMRRF
jgi:hypothetical protein